MSDTFRNSRAGGRSRQSSAADRIMAVQNARNKGTGARRGGSGRRRGRGRGRGQGPDMAKIVLIAIGVVIFLMCKVRETGRGIRNIHGGDNDGAGDRDRSGDHGKRDPDPRSHKIRGDGEGPCRYGMEDEGDLR